MKFCGRSTTRSDTNENDATSRLVYDIHDNCFVLDDHHHNHNQILSMNIDYENNNYVNTYSEEELARLKYEMEHDPLIPRTTKTFVVEYNIRYNNGEHKNTIAIEDKVAEQELMWNGITGAEICLMEYDIEGRCPQSEREVMYDRAVVRTNKPTEYWINHFK